MMIIIIGVFFFLFLFFLIKDGGICVKKIGSNGKESKGKIGTLKKSMNKFINFYKNYSTQLNTERKRKKERETN